jgi:RimJ/RimL family protein N-acetyltransferase
LSERGVTLRELDDVLGMQLRGTMRATLVFAPGFPRAEDLDALAAWERGALGFVVLDAAGTVLGTCGSHGPVVRGTLELGWGIVPAARGTGLGGAAVDCLLGAVRARHPRVDLVVRTEWELHEGAPRAVSPASEAILSRRGFRGGPAPAAGGYRAWSLSALQR